MKLRLPLLVVASVLLAAAGKPRTYMGYAVREMQFPIAGGEVVSLPVTDAGPIPAENRAFKIEVAGFSITPALFEPKRATLTWQFSLTAKSGKALDRVVVEEVFPSDTAQVLVDDRTPALKHTAREPGPGDRADRWLGVTAGVEPTSASTPWLFTEKASIFVFRFRIHPAGGAPVVLYQPAWFSSPAKEAFRQNIARINGG